MLRFEATRRSCPKLAWLEFSNGTRMPETTIRPARPSLGSVRLEKSGTGGHGPQSAGQLVQVSGGTAVVAQIPLPQTSKADARSAPRVRNPAARQATTEKVSMFFRMARLLALDLPVVIAHHDHVGGVGRGAGGSPPAVEDRVGRAVRVDRRADRRRVLAAGGAGLDPQRREDGRRDRAAQRAIDGRRPAARGAEVVV